MAAITDIPPVAQAIDGLPKRPRGRPSAAAELEYREQVAAFCALILQIDFAVGSRGWCYLLERHGLRKGGFDAAQRLINECRRSGELPLDICAEDASRVTNHQSAGLFVAKVVVSVRRPCCQEQCSNQANVSAHFSSSLRVFARRILCWQDGAISRTVAVT
jgi:hypothetical protein